MTSAGWTRLISDISDASRLGAELARAETTRVELVPLLETLIGIHRATADQDGAGSTSR